MLTSTELIALHFAKMAYVDLQYTEKFGETTVASTDIAYGATVATDIPWIVWDKNEDAVDDELQYMKNIYEAFMKVSEEDKLKILGLYSPVELDLEMSEFSSQLGIPESQKMNFGKLIAVCRINCYESHGGEKVALFGLGAKLSHSCSPNVIYNTSDGNMTVVALRDIKRGEVLCVSYITDAVRMQSTSRRDQVIFPKRLFHCNCDRCLSVDNCRTLKCTKCKTGRARLHPAPENTWKCEDCGVDISDADMLLSREGILEHMIEKHEQTLQSQDVDLDDFANTALGIIHEQHWIMALTRQLQFEKSLYMALYAERIDLIQFDKLDKFITYLKEAGLFPVIHTDLIASWCFTISKILNRSPVSPATQAAVSSLSRISREVYPQMRLYFGKNDAHVIHLAKLGRSCAECGQSEVEIKSCARCHEITYCSVNCQRSSWPTHKHSCTPKPK